MSKKIPFSEQNVAVMCWSCGWTFDKVKKSEGRPWCGCGQRDLVYVRPVKHGGLNDQ